MCPEAESRCSLDLRVCALYVMVNTACAVTEKDHKVFDFTGNLVRRQISQTVRFSDNPCHVLTS